MAQVHDIAGTTVNYIAQAIWDQPVQGESLDLIAVHQRWRRHVWRSNVMTAAEWATIIGHRGSIVSITTTDPDDPTGAYVTYYGAAVQSVSYRRHESLNFRGVEIEFLVKVP